MTKNFAIALSFVAQLLLAEIDMKAIYNKQEALNATEMQTFKALGNELRCPTCIGHSILESDAPFALQMRDALIDQIKNQKSSNDILTFFTQRYGDWILRKPPTQGFHWLAWLVPSIFGLWGLCFLWLRVFKKSYALPKNSRRSRQEILEEMQQALDRLRSRSH